MLKLKLQYFGRQMPRVNSLEKTLMLGEIESKRRGGSKGGVIYSVEVNLSKLQETVMDREPGVSQSTGSRRVGYE